MSDVIDRIKDIGGVFIDPWVAIGPDRKIVAFNSHYRALFSRTEARQLTGSPCCKALGLGVCENGAACLAQRVLADGPARFDEIDAQLTDEPTPRTAIVSAAPVEANGERVALLLIRDVSAQAGVQQKYRTMLETETRARDQLTQELGRRTRELKDANMALNRLQQELVRFRKGLFG
jgi:hypothetical protein